MKESISNTEKYLNGYSLIDLGYRDYIAARFLLNNHFIIQGLTLASTALEKYLKALIVFTSKEKEKYHYHFDNIEKLKNILSKNYHDITKEFDPVFISILKKAYTIRYYDNIKRPIKIGFYLNQFIGELDYTIHFFEMFVLRTQKNETPYIRAIENNDQHLYKNNFILKKQNKKDFMEKPGFAFSVQIQINQSIHAVKTVIGEKIAAKYEGHLSTFSGI